MHTYKFKIFDINITTNLEYKKFLQTFAYALLYQKKIKYTKHSINLWSTSGNQRFLVAAYCFFKCCFNIFFK